MGHCAARAGPRMTPLAVTAKRSVAPLNAVARGIGLVLGTKPNSAEMRMLSPDSFGPRTRSRSSLPWGSHWRNSMLWRHRDRGKADDLSLCSGFVGFVRIP
jgi:hypothetical protein